MKFTFLVRRAGPQIKMHSPGKAGSKRLGPRGQQLLSLPIHVPKYKSARNLTALLTAPITLISLFLVSHFNFFLFIPCGRLSWQPVSFLLHVKYALSHRIVTRGQSNLTKSASRGAHSPVRGHPRGSKVVPLNSWGRVSY